MAGVSNSSPLLYLARLSDLDVLPKLFGHITIAEAVWRELVVEGKGKPGAAEVEKARGGWLSVESVANRESIADLAALGLHPGEAETILLANQIGQHIVFMDDERGVRLARAQGLEVVRTVAIYIAATRLGWIDGIRPKLDELRSNGFRLRDVHYRAILQAVGEL